MQLTIHTTESAPPASKPILDGIASDLGLVPNMAATIAASPALLRAFDGLRRAVGSAELDTTSREVAGVAVGVAVDNHYGVAFHSTVLGTLGVDEADLSGCAMASPPRTTSSPRPTTSHGRSSSAAARSTTSYRSRPASRLQLVGDPRDRRRVHVRRPRRRDRQSRRPREARRLPHTPRMGLIARHGATTQPLLAAESCTREPFE